MLVVAALGGNALLQRGEPLTAQIQRANIRRAAAALAQIVRAGHRLVITHGNGPQVGLLALQGAAYQPDEAFPLDVLGAETGGMIGYMIEQELENALDHAQPVATLLTQVVVDGNDPAFRTPTKFIGPVYTRDEAEARARLAGWTIAPDGDKWRRVVPSPKPQEIPDIRVLRLLLDQGVIVICTGGGGRVCRYRRVGRDRSAGSGHRDTGKSGGHPGGPGHTLSGRALEMDNPLTLTARVILFGVLPIAVPEAGLVALVWLIGLWAALFGAVMAFLAFRFRALRNEFAAYA